MKKVMDFNYRWDSLVKATRVFSNDHNQDSGEQELDLCNCSPHESMEENVSLVAPCNSCGGMKVVGQVHHIPHGPDFRTVWKIYPPH